MTKRIIAIIMAFIITLSLSGCGKSAAVKEAERLISAIGAVTAESAEAVEAAEAAYDALSETEKSTVKNYDELENARQELDRLQLESLRASLVGTWKLELDVTEAVSDKLTPQFSDQGISFADYLEPCMLRLTLELTADGVYRLTADEATMEQTRQRLLEAATACTEAYMLRGIADTLQETGVEGDFSTREGIEAAMGKTLEEILQSTLGMGLNEYAARTVEDVFALPAGVGTEGRYLVQPDTLYLSNDTELAPDGTVSAGFTLDGDELTLDVEQIVFDLPSLVFHRAG